MMSDPSTVPHTLGDKVNIGIPTQKGTCSFTLAAGRAGQTILNAGLLTPLYMSLLWLSSNRYKGSLVLRYISAGNQLEND